jgi:hypothetical protein
MNNKVVAEPPASTRSPVSNPPMNEQWKDYAMVQVSYSNLIGRWSHSYNCRLVRYLPMDKLVKPSFRYVVKSAYVRAVCEDVIRSWPGIKWDAEPLEVCSSLCP